MSPYVTQRSKEFWPDPLTFNPDRWAAPNDRPKFAYFPFGGGPRLCIGERFAWMESVLMITAIAQKWKLRLVPGHIVEPKPLITLRPKNGIKMRVEAR